jgi:hypothetical protein
MQVVAEILFRGREGREAAMATSPTNTRCGRWLLVHLVENSREACGCGAGRLGAKFDPDRIQPVVCA